MTEPIIQQHQLIMWCVVIIYMVIITVSGSYYSKYMRTAEAYFKAGNLIPWWAAGISMYVSNFTAYTFVGIASLVYIDGLAGLLLETGPALAFLIAAYVFAKRWHRLNLTSPPEYLESRFNPLTRQVFSIFGIGTSFIASGMRLYATCKLVESLMGLPLIPTIIVTGAVMILYTMLGGLWAVIVTDVVQFIIFFLAIIPLFIISVAHIFIDSSWAEFVARIPEGFASFPHEVNGRTWGWLLVFWLTYLFDYNGDWSVIQKMYCTPTEKDAKKAALLSMALSIPHAFLLLGPVFIARVLWSQELADPNVVSQAETVYGRVAVKLLPIGMVGIVAAAMFSATMDTLSASWSVRSASFVNDLYVRFMRPNAGDREQIFVGRLAVLVIGAIAISVAVMVAITSTGLFALAQGLVGLVVIPIILPLLFGLLLPRAHKWSALAAMLVCLGFTSINKRGYSLLGLTDPLAFELEVLIGALLAGGVMLLSSILPQSATDRERIRAFFERMKSPHPNPTSISDIPSPVGIIGSVTLIMGVLVLLLSALPQDSLNRVVTLGSAVALIALGLLMRWYQKRSEGLIAVERAGASEVSQPEA